MNYSWDRRGLPSILIAPSTNLQQNLERRSLSNFAYSESQPLLDELLIQQLSHFSRFQSLVPADSEARGPFLLDSSLHSCEMADLLVACLVRADRTYNPSVLEVLRGVMHLLLGNPSLYFPLDSSSREFSVMRNLCVSGASPRALQNLLRLEELLGTGTAFRRLYLFANAHHMSPSSRAVGVGQGAGASTSSRLSLSAESMVPVETSALVLALGPGANATTLSGDVLDVTGCAAVGGRCLRALRSALDRYLLFYVAYVVAVFERLVAQHAARLHVAQLLRSAPHLHPQPQAESEGARETELPFQWLALLRALRCLTPSIRHLHRLCGLQAELRPQIDSFNVRLSNRFPCFMLYFGHNSLFVGLS